MQWWETLSNHRSAVVEEEEGVAACRIRGGLAAGGITSTNHVRERFRRQTQGGVVVSGDVTLWCCSSRRAATWWCCSSWRLLHWIVVVFSVQLHGVVVVRNTVGCCNHIRLLLLLPQLTCCCCWPRYVLLLLLLTTLCCCLLLHPVAVVVRETSRCCSVQAPGVSQLVSEFLDKFKASALRFGGWVLFQLSHFPWVGHLCLTCWFEARFFISKILGTFRLTLVGCSRFY